MSCERKISRAVLGGELLDPADRQDAVVRVVVEAGLDALLHGGRGVGDVDGEEQRPGAPAVRLQQQRVVPDRVARRLVQEDPLGELDVAAHGLEVEALVVPRLVRVAEELERLVVAGLRDLLLVDHGARAREQLVAADVVDVEVRVDERRHVARARSRRPRAARGSSARASARAARRAARGSCDRGRCRCRRGTARRRARPARCRRGCAPAGPGRSRAAACARSRWSRCRAARPS